MRDACSWMVGAFAILLGSGCGGSATQDDGQSGGAPSGGGSPATGGAAAGGTSTGGTSTGGTSTGGQSSGGSGGGGTCSPACGDGRDCCAGACVNFMNDPHNCGKCGGECQSEEYCGGGQCQTPPCSAQCSGGACCGTQCCQTGQLCCDPQGPLDMGPTCVEPSETGTCPQGCAPLCICASPDTPIATPSGERPIASLRVGDLVYSVDGFAVKAVPLVAVHRTAVEHHRVVRVKLDNGATLDISAGHPTADGRTFGDLRVGSTLDRGRILSADSIPYEHSATYDILPSSDSGTYFAGGELIGSTLFGKDPAALPAACQGTP